MPKGDKDFPNTPDLDKSSLKANKLSIETIDQAISVCENLIEENKDRVAMSANVQEQIDAIVPPYSPSELADEEQGWRTNVATGVLSSISERVLPRLTLRIKSSRYITTSSLPSSVPDYVTKTESYRKQITDLIRQWKKFNIFLNSFTKESVNHGWSFVWYDNPIDWRPKVSRSDRAFIPNGTEQGEPPQFFMVKEYYRINELWEMIEDKEIAEDVGYNIEAMVNAINAASPITGKEGDKGEQARTYVDLEREVVSSSGYMQGANTVEVWHLFSMEHDGTVSQRMINSKTKEELFFSESRYDSMDEVVVPVPFQFGDGTVHGSMGVGKMCYDLAYEIEKTRNSAIDGFRNRSKFAIELSDSSDKPETSLTINETGAFLQGGKYAGSTGMLPENVEALIQLDEFLRRILEQKVGVYLFEPLTPQAPKTATEAQIIALEGEEIKNSILDNYLSSVAKVMALMAKRAMSGLSDDRRAIEARENLLRVMSEEELSILVENTPTQTVVDSTQAENERIAQWLESKKGNPFYNQHEIERLQGSIIVPLEIVDQVLMPVNDPTEEAEQVRLQLMENELLKQGTPVPVSSRDNHQIHMSVLIGQPNEQTGQSTGALEQAIESGDLQTAVMLQRHLIEHAEFAQSTMGEGLNDFKQYVTEVQGRISAMQEEFSGEESQPTQMTEEELNQFRDARAIAQGLDIEEQSSEEDSELL